MTLKRTENISCDGEKCDKTRDQDSNHWLVGQSDDVVIIVTTKRNLIPGNYKQEEVKDFCGEQHAIQWVSKMLTEIKK
jgi:hypothetical protein